MIAPRLGPGQGALGEGHGLLQGRAEALSEQETQMGTKLRW